MVSERHIVTAAHCVQYQPPDEIFVGVGDHEREEEDDAEILVAVVRVEIHPGAVTFSRPHKHWF